MMKTKLMIGAALAAVCLSGPANASNCAPREAVVDRLASKYGESRQSMGLGANNAVIEVFASQETGTWTITVTSVHGVTCLVASGQAFEAMADVLPAEGNDA
ncbi:MAG: hypothetical protein AAFW87_09915 [Pseudomonadota bacterium]